MTVADQVLAAQGHNHVKRVWHLTKHVVAADRLAGSIEELAACARRFLDSVKPPAFLLEADPFLMYYFLSPA